MIVLQFEQENWPHIGDSGTVDASVSNTQVIIVIFIYILY